MTDGELGRIEDAVSDYNHGRSDGLTQGYADGQQAFKIQMMNHERNQHSQCCACQTCSIYDRIALKALAAQRQEIW